MRPPPELRRALKRPLRSRATRRALLSGSALSGRGLTLLFHRIAPEGPQDHEIVRSVPAALFRRQLEVLVEAGDVVPADELADVPAAGTRPRFALTFDDDYATQLDAARILVELGLPGTFFLSGRSLHGLGAYWWELLESRIAEDGLTAVATSLDVPAATPQELAAVCEGTVRADRLAREADALPAAHLDAAAIGELAALPGIRVGFHTVDHPVLPRLDDAALEDALVRGRDALETATGTTIDLLAYPHGKADDRVAARSAALGYRRAWTGRIEPTVAATDPHLLGRWEPHELAPDDFAVQLAIRTLLPDRGA